MSYIQKNKDSYLAELYDRSGLKSFFSSVYEMTFGEFNKILLPTEDKLIPDWPSDPYYNNQCDGLPVPPLLIIDVEKTIIGAEHNPKDGWRYAKRPGLEMFLKQLRSNYEIALVFENDNMLEVLDELERAGEGAYQFFRVGPAGMELRDGNQYIKHIDRFNRDPKKILILDDSEIATQLCSENTLIVEPFEIQNTNDTLLLDLIPLLQAFVNEQVDDFPAMLRRLGTYNAREAATEYLMRLHNKFEEEKAKKNRGVGGLIRSKMPVKDPEREVSPPKSFVAWGMDGKAPGLLPKLDRTEPADASPGFVTERSGTVVAAANEKKKGALSEFLEQVERDREEARMRKNQELEEAFRKKQLNKQQINK